MSTILSALVKAFFQAAIGQFGDNRQSPFDHLDAFDLAEQVGAEAVQSDTRVLAAFIQDCLFLFSRIFLPFSVGFAHHCGIIGLLSFRRVLFLLFF